MSPALSKMRTVGEGWPEPPHTLARSIADSNTLLRAPDRPYGPTGQELCEQILRNQIVIMLTLQSIASRV